MWGEATTTNFKLRSVGYAPKNENWAAQRQFEVTEKIIRGWREPVSVFQTVKPTKKAGRRKKAHLSELENSLRMHLFSLQELSLAAECYL